MNMLNRLFRRLVAASLMVTAVAVASAQGLGPTGLPMNPNAAPRANLAGGAGMNGFDNSTNPAANGNTSSGLLYQLMAWERQDMGVRPSPGLHNGQMHGPTPNTIAGGQVITTKGLLPLLQQGMPVLVFDALGSGQMLPNAIPAAWTAQPGGFDDGIQQQMAQMLRQLTRGNNATPLVFYCGGPQCWMSYNASVRAIQLGYRNVLWYRGGLEAWQRAGLQVVQAGQQEGAYPGGPRGSYPNAQPRM